ncbi:Glycerophosphodiester phosphodiesterase GDPDL3 [Hibiscus syriacus]|uniref:glycerophosphodiester phosphodiesterase n=1 Tax=Hibiscus syriacus TaxID=106335 RepID=A0A6A3D039_HIBSY|nr:Glycerophosphodiester phosphodiesterase GDPDL3 [Hibiscus syriacus]
MVWLLFGQITDDDGSGLSVVAHVPIGEIKRRHFRSPSGQVGSTVGLDHGFQFGSERPPLVIACGGFSGMFADSSFGAYSLALLTSLPDVILWCDVQLTRDAAGICFPDLKLNNNSDVANVYSDRQRTYLVNGVSTKGWFSIDFTLRELGNVILTQGIFSRTNKFDGQNYPIMTAQDTYTQLSPPGFWLNIQLQLPLDPVAEYLQFVNNGQFSVDEVISDFPITPSAAKATVDLLVISSKGASGDFPGCTDSAYSKAIQDGVDVLDCPVQMTMDGTPICLSFINLIDSTTVVQTSFSNLSTTIPEIKQGSGIFTFNMSWNDIQSLIRKNAGKFLSLSDFLTMARNASSIQGVLISIENAAFLAEQGLGVTDAVIDALSKAGYNNQTALKVMIQSSKSSVLLKFKSQTNYDLFYKIDEDIGGTQNSTIDDIKRFCNTPNSYSIRIRIRYVTLVFQIIDS